MKIEKILEDIVKLDGLKMYTTNLKETLLDVLNDKHKGRNFKGCYVLSVDEIIRHSDRDISHTNDAFVVVTCMFRASCYVFDMDEVIFCKIIKKDMTITASNEYAGIKIIKPQIDTFTVGRTIPVLVRATIYDVAQTKVTIIARQFVPIHRVNFKIVDDQGMDDTQFIAYKTHMSKLIEIEHKKIDRKSKSTAFFMKMTENKIPGKWVPIDSISNIKNGMIVSYDTSSIDCGLYVLNENQVGEVHVHEEKLSVVVLKSMLSNLKHLIMLDNLVKHYPDSNSIKDLSLTWKVYQQMKK